MTTTFFYDLDVGVTIGTNAHIKFPLQGARLTASRRHDRDVDRRAQFSTDLEHFVDIAGHELIERRVVLDGIGIGSRERLLLKDIVEAGRPFACAETGRGRAVVDHVGDAFVVHIG